MRTILVGSDFSPRSDRALRRATLLARETGATLVLASAIDGDRAEPLVAAEQREAQALLTTLAQTLQSADGVATQTHVQAGDAEDVLAALARRVGADLILIGPHRRRALVDLFATTTAGRIVRQSGCPVLVANSVPAGPWRHILVASDLSPAAGAALAYLAQQRFAQAAGIRLFHGFEPLPHGFLATSGMTARERSAEVAELSAKAAARLEAQAKEAGLDRAERVVSPLLQGPAESILAAAADMGADLVVVGKRGASGVERLLLGSVAEAVLAKAGCDVLVVPPAAGD